MECKVRCEGVLERPKEKTSLWRVYGLRGGTDCRVCLETSRISLYNDWMTSRRKSIVANKDWNKWNSGSEI